MSSGFPYVSFICKIKFCQEMENKKIVLKRILITLKCEYFYLLFILSSLRINTAHQDCACYTGNLTGLMSQQNEKMFVTRGE